MGLGSKVQRVGERQPSEENGPRLQRAHVQPAAALDQERHQGREPRLQPHRLLQDMWTVGTQGRGLGTPTWGRHTGDASTYR